MPGSLGFELEEETPCRPLKSHHAGQVTTGECWESGAQVGERRLPSLPSTARTHYAYYAS